MAAAFRHITFLLCAALLAACGVENSLEQADKEIAAFHTGFNREDGVAIYATTSPGFRAVTTQQAFQEMIASMHGRFGDFKSTERQAWRSGFENTTSYVVIETLSKFDNGDGNEVFTFVDEGGKLLLQGWDIRSTAPLPLP